MFRIPLESSESELFPICYDILSKTATFMPKNASKHRRKIIFHSKALEAQVNQKEAQVNQKEVNLCERPDNANLNLLTCATYHWKAQNPNIFQSVMTFCRKMPPSCRKMHLNMCEKSFFIVML